MISSALVALLLTQSYYTPAEAQAIFAQAAEAYSREDYAAARGGLEKLLQHGYGGGDVLYNLGTIALADGDLGHAVLYLERARRLGRSGEDLEANLAMARSKQLDQVVGAQANEPFHQRLAEAIPDAWSGWLFLVAWTAAFALLVVFRFLRPGRRAWAAVAAGLCFGLAVPSGAVLATQAYVAQTVLEGVVLAGTLKARDLPKESARVSFEVHAGLKVRVMESAGRYLRIRLPNGLEGWTEAEGVAEL